MDGDISVAVTFHVLSVQDGVPVKAVLDARQMWKSSVPSVGETTYISDFESNQPYTVVKTVCRVLGKGWLEYDIYVEPAPQDEFVKMMERMWNA